MSTNCSQKLNDCFCTYSSLLLSLRYLASKSKSVCNNKIFSTANGQTRRYLWVQTLGGATNTEQNEKITQA